MAFDLSDINKVVDGTVAGNKTDSTSKSPNNALGKDAFLQLLVTQMKYQDPLNPSSDTDFIAQLAQFSSLEQLQNLNQSFSDTNAMSMVGKNATVSFEDESGKTHSVTGIVDYVTKSGNTLKVSIDGELYNAEDVTSVFDANYIAMQYLPTVTAKNAVFDLGNPEDMIFEVTLGEKEYEASSVAIMVGDKTIDSKYLKYKDGKLTVDKEAFEDMNAGTYEVAFVFGNAVYTTITDKVTLTVKGISEVVDA